MAEFRYKFIEWFFTMWRPILIFLGVATIVCFLFGANIGSLTKGASQPETTYINSISSGKELLKHPVYIVHKLPVYFLFKLNVNRVAFYRAVSAAFASLAVVSCFFILREWYTNRIALLGSWLFATSAWILHTGRLATPEASFLLLMPLLWAAVWLYYTTLHKTALFTVSLLCALIFYIPGFGWLLLITAVWKHKRIWDEVKNVPWWFRVICASIIVVGLVPLIYASALDSKELLLASGLPNYLPSPKQLFINLINIPGYLVFRGPYNPVVWLGNIPILDVFSSAMLVLGLYSIRYHLKLIRIQLLLGSSLFLTILIMSGGALTITVLMPAIYILIAGGVAFFLQQWFTVFPHNPIARTLATTLLGFCILLVSYYHLNQYFVAWPKTPATRSAFSHTLVK